MGSDSWEWFCGVNSSDLHFFDGFAWNKDHISNNTCFTDALDAAPHAVFLVVFSFLLFVMGCCTGYRAVNTKYLLRYKGHAYKWMLLGVLLLVHLTSIGEGILTDENYSGQPSQPHFYLPSIAAFVTAFLALIFYHHMELWQCASMAVFLVLYWTMAILGEVAVLLNLISLGQTGYDCMRFDLTICTLVLYSIILLLELNIIRINVCGCCQNGDGKSLPRDLRAPDMHYLDQHVNLLSQVTYWWLNWLLKLGYKRPLEMTDLGALPLIHESNYNHNRFRDVFEKEKEEKAKVGKKPGMWTVYLKVYGWRNFWAAIIKLVGDCMGYIGPLCVGGITLYVQNVRSGNEPKNDGFITFTNFFANGFVLVGVMFFTAVIKFLSLQTHYHWVILESMHVRTAIQTMVYEKSLRLSTYATTGGMMTMGQITNHMSTDAMALLFCFQMIHYCWAIPIQIIVTLVLLYQQLGLSALLGSAVFVVLLPFQMKIASLMSKLQKTTLNYSDTRLKLSNEMLQGIKLLKLYGWEELYCSAIEAVRINELWAMFKINGNVVATIFITSTGPVLVTLVSFGTYTLFTGKPLLPDVAFSSLSFFNQLTIPLFLLPVTLSVMVNAVVSSNRLLNFFLAPEVETAATADVLREESTDDREENGQVPAVGFRQPSSSEKASLLNNEETAHKYSYGSVDRLSKSEAAPSPIPEDVAVKMVNASFTWDSESNVPIISRANVEIPAGKLTMIVGQVGSGKSSLISAILGEMTTMSGSVLFNRTKSSIAYAAQKAWLLNASLKDNIIFNSELDNKRYRKVLKSCALEPDIEILPGGDQTEIGEKGINLSGGQKQRVSVGRAMYSNRDIVILDDPLSALDVHVGKTLFEEGIMNLLIKNKQTVILVTHQLQYLQEADKILVMQDGRIQHQGTLDEIAAADPTLYSSWNEAIAHVSEAEAADPSGNESESETERTKLKRQISRQMTVEEEEKKKAGSEEGKLIEKEEMERGSVSYKVYLYYLGAITFPVVFIVTFFILCQSGIRIGTNFWLSAWSESNLNQDANSTDDDLTYWIGGYAGLSFGTIIAQLIASALLVFSSLIAARSLHLAMLHTIIRVPMRFFDTTPIGRIINRFSNDTQIIDMKLINTLNGLLGSIMNCLSAIVVNAVVTPIFLAVVFPVAIAYFFLQKYFITTSRELQRLDSVSKSPVFAYFSETLGGLATLRAYNSQKTFYRTIMERINVNNTAYLYLQTANRWLAARLDFIGALVVLLAGLTTTVSAIAVGSVSASEVGLAISYALQVSGYLNWVVRTAADTEMQMNAVERVKYYSSLKREQYEGMEPPLNWPQRGQISVDNVSVRYAADLDPVLQEVSVNIRAGEKVGICGRTGSGKSSLTLALFRIIDIFRGRILIDGVDIATVPLTTLRQRLAIIPQDPVLFTGTIRRNLDPESKRTDQELWQALEIAQLKDVVGNLEEGLESKVTEGGENYSVGQRQLFCLARAFLRKSQILIMDEATASIDMQTDQILQEVVASAFADRTVLTIAHRIATILNSDSILVLSDGKVIEYDTPDNLLAREDSVFSSLVRGSQ